MSNKNNKNILILIMLIAIIVVLLAGVIYQFVVIKTLEGKIDNLSIFFQNLKQNNAKYLLN